MITMVDEIYDRRYQAGRAQLHNGIDALLGKLSHAFGPALLALHHVEWDAPWAAHPNGKAKV
jgi:hypothetical protein